MRIVQIGDVDDSILFKKAEPVEYDHNLRRLMDRMLETMRAKKGNGLAGPQVGLPKRVIVIGGSAGAPFALANPEILSRSENVMLCLEGCLSIPNRKRVPVVRFAEVEVAGIDRKGKPFRIKAKGILSSVLQHEIDHLDGITILDREVKLEKKEDGLHLVEVGEPTLASVSA